MRDVRAQQLTGQKATLRPPSRSDVEWLAAALNDPEFHGWMPMVPYPYTLTDAERFICHTEEGWENSTECAFFISSPDFEELCGGITLHLVGGDAGMAGVGYWLARPARGRGLATDALQTIAAWAFSDLGVERLHRTTLPDNRPSQQVAERAGFVREGLLRSWALTDEGRKDAFVYSRLARD